MSKRGAASYLTDQNWDHEEESEEAGTFAQASADEISKRQIRKARRRVADIDTEGSKPAFKGFSGFGDLSGSNTSSKPSFNFGSTDSKSLFSFSNGSSSKSDTLTTSLTANALVKTTAASDAILKSSSSLGGSTSITSVSNTNHANDDSKKNNSNRTKYLQQLRALNKSVSDWIKKHVEENASCILTPIFQDYEKHLADIEKKYPENEQSQSGASAKDDNTSTSAATGSDGSVQKSSTDGFIFSIEKSTKSKKAKSEQEKPTFSFGLSTAAKSATTGFSFGQTSTSEKSSLFNSGGSTSFSFAVSAPPSAQSEDAAKNDEEEYAPPKTEVVEVKEDGSLYTKRCKLFYQKDGNWLEKGVGNLHLKSLADKNQLLIRADTNLGNILLNIMLTESMPVKRQGKNNVSLICIPNPPLNPKDTSNKPASLLLRVKTGEDADQLLNKINELKK